MLEYLVGFCVRRPWLVVLATLLLTGAGVYLLVDRFAIDTDTSHLFASTIPWRKNEAKLYQAFPDLDDLIVIVIDGPTPEKTEDAAKRLTDALTGAPTLLRVWRPDDNAFFRDKGLLYLDSKEVQRVTATLIAQRDILQPLAEDPSLRGLSAALLDNMRQIGGSARGMEQFSAGLNSVSKVFEAALRDDPARLDWEKLLAVGDVPEAAPSKELRRLVLVKPQLDYNDLTPAAGPIALVRKTAAALGLVKDPGLRVRLTGLAALADDEYATITENMEINLAATLAIVTLILFAALRSPKLILAVLATLLAGLAMTAGIGILLIGRFNMISVAFAALFIGLGVDFGIQFATRYREERHKALISGDDGVDAALVRAGGGIGGSLTLAAVSLLAGFFCFLPTEFKGVSELGLIAGCGMIVAYVATLSFLPATIKLLNPRAEKLPVETAVLAHVDKWILSHRAFVIITALSVTVAAAPFLMHLKFDSNPMDLRSQKVESVKTFIDLSKNPATAPNTIEALAPSLEAANGLADRLKDLPEVDHVTTVESLIPKDQEPKLALLQNALWQMRRVFDPRRKPAPTDEETKRALSGAAMALKLSSAKSPPAAERFRKALEALVQASPTTRERAQTAVFEGFPPMLADIRKALSLEKITPETLPKDLARDWISAEGLYRVEVSAKGDSNDRTVMNDFGAAVQKIAPDASGGPIIVFEAGETIVRAFILAGVYAFVAIFVILAVALRNPIDVALTLGPLLLAGALSLETADYIGMSLNFANIISLPLMFAVGVAFHIYYVIAWRKGVVDVLASSLTRAIFFSALTTGTAFGSLILSSHPGTASMGELLAIALFYTLVAAFLVVPAFLGPPRHPAEP
ncbi:MAG TPA: MMPL family transporter [Methylocystis sp.]|nr:MMPL family transporter [Methylocystis sp.]